MDQKFYDRRHLRKEQVPLQLAHAQKQAFLHSPFRVG
jgi:hypothetical protein